jgi:NitT/TauT family transport system substrate-binding protein
MKRFLALALALPMAFGLALPATAGEPVTFAYSQLGYIGHLPWTVALGQKYFEEQGLEVKGYNFESGGKSIAAVLGGSADFAANALEHAIKAKAQGKDLVYVFASVRAPAWGLAVSSAHRNEIKSVADLKGKTVGVSGIGVASHVLLNYMLVKAGVDPKDVKIVAVGISTLPPALEGGKIVAGMAAEPFFSRMIKKGTAFSMGNLNSIKETTEILGGEYAFAGCITRPEVIEKRPHQVQKVVTALVKAAHFIQTNSPEKIAAAIPAEFAGDRAQLTETIAGTKEVFAPTGMVSQVSVDTLMKVLHAFPGVFKPGQQVDVPSTYDMRFVQQAVKDLRIQ